MLHKAVCFASQVWWIAPAWAVPAAGRGCFGAQAAWGCIFPWDVCLPNKALELLPLRTVVVSLHLSYYSDWRSDFKMISVCAAETDQLWQLVLASESRVLAEMQSISRYLTFFLLGFFLSKGKKKRNKIVNAQDVGWWHWPFLWKGGKVQ